MRILVPNVNAPTCFTVDIASCSAEVVQKVVSLRTVAVDVGGKNIEVTRDPDEDGQTSRDAGHEVNFANEPWATKKPG